MYTLPVILSTISNVFMILDRKLIRIFKNFIKVSNRLNVVEARGRSHFSKLILFLIIGKTWLKQRKNMVIYGKARNNNKLMIIEYKQYVVAS